MGAHLTCLVLVRVIRTHLAERCDVTVTTLPVYKLFSGQTGSGQVTSFPVMTATKGGQVAAGK